MAAIFKLVTKYSIALSTAVLVSSCMSLDYDPLQVTIKGDKIIAAGVIDSSTPDVLGDAIRQYPEAKTLILYNVPGSADDVANLEIAREVRAAGIATYIPSDGMVASGGTDLFLAGKTRTIEAGACLGVHSWAEGSAFGMKQGREFPKDHEEHQKYLSYYDAMGIDQSFYWYTLDAADAENIHWMTEGELKKYNVGTILKKGSGQKAAKSCDARG